jgi:hypothetical protein
MFSGSTWLKRTHESFHHQLNQTFSYLMTPISPLARMGLTGMDTWLNDILSPKVDALNTAFTAWYDPSTRTPLIVAALRDAEEAVLPVYRTLYNMLRNTPLVTNVDLLVMGLPERSSSSGHKPSPEPKTAPYFEFRLSSVGVIDIIYRDSTGDAKKLARPKGVAGVEIVWAILDTPPNTVEQLTNTSFDTATPFRFKFTFDKRSKRVYVALRWTNTRSIKGPWSDIQSTIIP